MNNEFNPHSERYVAENFWTEISPLERELKNVIQDIQANQNKNEEEFWMKMLDNMERGL